MQLQSAKQRFAAQGLKLAAISYDSPGILKDFADRHGIDFPLLADPNSEIIRKFNVLNAEAKGMTKGMAYPGFFYIDAGGVIREKYFTAKYTDRLTANNLDRQAFSGVECGSEPERRSAASSAYPGTIGSQRHTWRPRQPHCRY